MNDRKTLGDTSRETGIPYHRLNYAVLASGVKAVGRAGNVRLFDSHGIERILEFVRARGRATA